MDEYAKYNSQAPALAPKEPPAVVESIQAGHRYASALSEVLESLLGDLLGYGADVAATGASPSCGLVNDAELLASRLNGLISTAERIKDRLSPPKVHELRAGTMGISAGRM
jgi:hypothetical protein